MENIKRISDSGQKVPEKVRNKMNAMSKQFYVLIIKLILKGLKHQIESGKIAPEIYKSFLEKQIAKDKTLFSYLNKFGQKRKMAIVKERIGIIQKEIDSADV